MKQPNKSNRDCIKKYMLLLLRLCVRTSHTFTHTLTHSLSTLTIALNHHIRMIRNEILESYLCCRIHLSALMESKCMLFGSSCRSLSLSSSVKKIISAWEMITIFGIYFLCQFHGYDFTLALEFSRGRSGSFNFFFLEFLFLFLCSV